MKEYELNYLADTMGLRARYHISFIVKQKEGLDLPWHCHNKDTACADCKPMFTPEVLKHTEMFGRKDK